jgi:hypothetical protein
LCGFPSEIGWRCVAIIELFRGQSIGRTADKMIEFGNDPTEMTMVGSHTTYVPFGYLPLLLGNGLLPATGVYAEIIIQLFVSILLNKMRGCANPRIFNKLSGLFCKSTCKNRSAGFGSAHQVYDVICF